MYNLNIDMLSSIKHFTFPENLLTIVYMYYINL